MITAPVIRINLLSKQKTVYDKQMGLATQVKVGAGVVLVVYLLVLAGVVGARVIVNNRYKVAEDAISQVKTSLAAYIVPIKQYELVNQKTKIISKLIKERREVIELWQQLQQIIPPGCLVKNFFIKENALTFSVTANNFLSANQAVKVIEENRAVFSGDKATVSIRRSEDGSYSINVTVTLKTDVKEKKT